MMKIIIYYINFSKKKNIIKIRIKIIRIKIKKIYFKILITIIFTTKIQDILTKKNI